MDIIVLELILDFCIIISNFNDDKAPSYKYLYSNSLIYELILV